MGLQSKFIVFSRNIHVAVVKHDSAAACENDNNFAIETFSIFSKTETVVHINFCISTSEMSLGFISLRNFHSMSVTQHLNYILFFLFFLIIQKPRLTVSFPHYLQ